MVRNFHVMQFSGSRREQENCITWKFLGVSWLSYGPLPPSGFDGWGICLLSLVADFCQPDCPSSELLYYVVDRLRNGMKCGSPIRHCGFMRVTKCI